MTVKKSFSIFIAIVILSIIGVLFSSIDKSTFTLLGNADWRYLIPAFGLVVLGWLLDSLKFFSLARAAGERLLFRTTIGVVWINYFGCAITPMQSGGGPFQVYMLYKAGVSVGKSIAITLVRTLQILFLLALVTPFSYFFDPKLFEQHKYIRWYAYYIAVFVALCTFLIVVSIIRPNWIKHWVNAFLFWLKRIGLLKPKYLMKAVRWVDHEVDSYNTNIKLFTSTGKRWFLFSTLVAIVHLIVYLSVMPCLIKAAGFHVNYVRCLLAESLFLFMLYFVPTPGASGAAEGGAAAIFALFVPWSLAGVMAVSWRLITEYTGVALGTFIVVQMLGWGGADKVFRSESKKIQEAKESEIKDEDK